jgi:hypothetical protein
LEIFSETFVVDNFSKDKENCIPFTQLPVIKSKSHKAGDNSISDKSDLRKGFHPYLK